MTEPMRKFEILKSERILENRWLPVEKQLVRLPNGETADWYITHTTDAVIVVPVLANGNILLQHNYKHGAGEVVTEFCAGLIDEGEEPLTAAKRELLEETGYTAETWEHLGTTFANPSGSTMRYHIYLAEGTKKIQDQELEGGEQIETFTVPDLEAAASLLCDSETKSAVAALTALLFAQNCSIKKT